MSAESERLVLHALRVKGAAGTDAVAQASGVADADAELDGLVDADLVTRVGVGADAIYGLTEAGRDRDHELVEEEVPGEGRERLASLYEAKFLPVNVEFKGICAEWQTEGQSFERLLAVLDVHERIESFLGAAADPVPWLGRYATRLERALERVQDGDSAALVGPVGDSYHNVWFELHEDLIATLGRSRADEES